MKKVRERSITTGISIEMELLEEIDNRRREIGLREGKDLARSTYINQLLKLALNHEKKAQ